MTGLFDIHCHIVPHVDDGSKSLEESRRMLEMEYEDGVRTIIMTPHFRYDMFETPLEEVKEQFERVKEMAEQQFKDLRVFLGCELHSSMDMVSCLDEGRRLTLAGSRYVLAEFSARDTKGYIMERVRQLVMNGYHPIIAHLERYPAVRGDLEMISDLRDVGAYIQINADTISGKDGLGEKWFAKKLMKRGLLDFVGSDAHGCKSRVPGMAKAWNQVVKTMGKDYAYEIFVENPSEILEG